MHELPPPRPRKKRPRRLADKEHQDAVEHPDDVARFNEFARRLRYVREKIDVLQAELAEGSRKSLHAVRSAEGGLRSDVFTLLASARVLGIQFSRLWDTPEKWSRFVAEWDRRLAENVRRANAAARSQQAQSAGNPGK